MAQPSNGENPNGSSPSNGSAFADALRLLYPGLGFKRWLLLGAAGVFAGAVGVAYLVKHLLPIPFPNFLPTYFEGVFFSVLALSLVVLSVYGLYRSLGPLLLSSSPSSNGLAHTLYSRRQQERGPRWLLLEEEPASLPCFEASRSTPVTSPPSLP